MSIEAVMIFPLLFWSIWASYTFFDGYRQSARNLKAAYAVADILSREKNLVTANYISNMYDLQKFMVADRSTVSMRISFVRFNAGENEADGGSYEKLWSCVRGDSFDELDNQTLNEEFKGRIPVMADRATMILVETKDWYTRPFRIGYGDHSFAIDKFIFTQPRGYTQIVAADDC